MTSQKDVALVDSLQQRRPSYTDHETYQIEYRIRTRVASHDDYHSTQIDLSVKLELHL